MIIQKVSFIMNDSVYLKPVIEYIYIYILYFQAHKTHREFFVRNFRKNYERTLILVIYWTKTGLLHTKISNHNIIYPS